MLKIERHFELHVGPGISTVFASFWSITRRSIRCESLFTSFLSSITFSFQKVDSEGRTSLIAACYMGHLECVRELIIWAAEIETMDQV